MSLLSLLVLGACTGSPEQPAASDARGLDSRSLDSRSLDSRSLDSRGGTAPPVAPPEVGSSPTTLDLELEGQHAIVGDVNGDGRQDLVALSGGRALVFMGRSDGITTRPVKTLRPGFGEGAVVAGVGDVDGDGYDDVAIGNPTARGGIGRVQVFHGGRGGLRSIPSRTLTITAADAFGAEVAGAGDVNGDGYDDVAVYIAGRGRARVYYGSATGLDDADFTSLDASWHDVSSSIFADGAAVTGSGMAGGGDIDGDGYDELIISYPTWNDEDGAFYVFWGAASGIGTSGSLVTYPWAGYTSSWCDGPPSMGWSLATGVDMDGDGYDDILAGAPFDTCEGWAYAWFGSASGVETSTWVEFYAYDSEDYVVSFASTVAAGDFDGDGVGDYAFGGSLATAAEGPFPSSDPDYEDWTNPDAFVALEHWSDTSSPMRVSAGDVNGDGYDDVAVARNEDGTWIVEVYYGAP